MKFKIKVYRTGKYNRFFDKYITLNPKIKCYLEKAPSIDNTEDLNNLLLDSLHRKLYAKGLDGKNYLLTLN